MHPRGMKTYREKRQVRNFMYSPIVLVLLGLIVIFFSRSVWQAYAKERASQVGYENSQAQLEELRTRKDALSKELEDLNSPEGIETELRNKFQVAKPGEEMITIIEPIDNKKSE